jgi:hypothetical protein
MRRKRVLRDLGRALTLLGNDIQLSNVADKAIHIPG